MNGTEIDGAAFTPGVMGPFAGLLVAVLVGVRVGVFVAVAVGVRVGVLVAVAVGVRVGVLVGVRVGVMVGVRVGVPVLGATHAGSVLVALLQGPVAEAQLEPVPQKTLGLLQAALLTVLHAPVVGFTQQPVACAIASCGEETVINAVAATAHETTPNTHHPTPFIIYLLR